MQRILANAPLDRSLPTRLFRAASPSDVVCAALLADRLPPGNDLLALARDRSQARPTPYRRCFESLVRLHHWRGIVDITGWSLSTDCAAKGSIRERWRRLHSVHRSMVELRRWIAPIVGVAPSDDAVSRRLDRGVHELYLTCLNHFDVRALYRMFPSARKMYYPHTLDSLAPSEADHYAPFCGPGRFQAADFLRDQFKRAVLGPDAVPVRHLRLDRVFSFRSVPGWTNDEDRLDVALVPATMARLFDRLPSSVRCYYTSLATRCGGGCGVLLLNPDDHGREHPYDQEVDGYVHLAGELRRQGAGTILVKPHSRSSVEWNARVRTALETRTEGGAPVFVERYYHYPIEITLAPFSPLACAGMGTTCLGTLSRIYGIASYCAEQRMLQINSWNVAWRDNFRVWVEDYGRQYVAV
jgi:hypothetical protein